MRSKLCIAAATVVLAFAVEPSYAQTLEAVDSKARGGLVAVIDRVALLEDLVAQLQSELSGAQVAIGAAQAELAGARSRIGALETDLATANSRIGILETDLSAANSRLIAAENGTASLQTQVASLQDSDSIQDDIIIGLRVDLSEAERLALRSETRSSGGVARKLSLKDPILTFRTNNTAAVAAIDETLVSLNEFRCRTGLSGCTDPSIEQLVDFLPVESALTFEATVDGWESDLAGLRSIAVSGTTQLTEAEILGVLDDIETDVATLGEIGQLAALDLQDSVQKLNAIMQTISNIMKQSHDTLMAIINNLR